MICWTLKYALFARTLCIFYKLNCPWLFLIISFLNSLEYLIHYLWDNRIVVCLYRFLPPLWKGNTVQSGGNPIISATNRGLSREVFPIRRAHKWFSSDVRGLPSFRSFAVPGLWQLVVGVGNIPWKSMKSIRPFGRLLPFLRLAIVFAPAFFKSFTRFAWCMSVDIGVGSSSTG